MQLSNNKLKYGNADWARIGLLVSDSYLILDSQL